MRGRQGFRDIIEPECEKVADLLSLDIEDFQELPLADLYAAAMTAFDQDAVQKSPPRSSTALRGTSVLRCPCRRDKMFSKARPIRATPVHITQYKRETTANASIGL